MSKGIYQRIREAGVSTIERFSIKDLEKALQDLQARRIEKHKEDELVIKNNMKHLDKRSKELNKPIPEMLLIVMCSPVKMTVGSAFIEEYKEWL